MLVLNLTRLGEVFLICYIFVLQPQQLVHLDHLVSNRCPFNEQINRNVTVQK